VTPDDIGTRLVEAVGDGAVSSVSGGGQHARATVDVPTERWRQAALAARDQLGCDFFDWLSAVDEGDAGFDVVAHVWSTADRHGALLRTRVPRDAPVVDTVTDIYPGANWHERETAEMFGIDVTGHPNPLPLLLPPEFEGHPLRKEFVLASRVVKAWPGAKEPGGDAAGGGGRARQPARPLGVPNPEEWGPAVAPPVD
jgi:NADH-quinone oxidoreductase subunit C